MIMQHHKTFSLTSLYYSGVGKGSAPPDLCFTGCGHEVRRLFEGGVTNVKTLAAGGDYSRVATIRGRRLIDEIRYITIPLL